MFDLITKRVHADKSLETILLCKLPMESGGVILENSYSDTVIPES